MQAFTTFGVLVLAAVLAIKAAYRFVNEAMN